MRAVAARIAPSWRSLLLAAALLVLAVGAYAAARETSMFAVRKIEIEGASPGVAAQVRAALEPLVGRSLLKLGGDDVDRRLAGIAAVAWARTDRDFPHTLRLRVAVERPLAVLRQGASAWLVAADNRVIRALVHPARSALPRVWLPRGSTVSPGGTLTDGFGARATAALRALRLEAPGIRPRDVLLGPNELTVRLRSGLEIRLGDTTNLYFKLAVAREILPRLSPPGYLDVSVPQRAVAKDNSQVSG